MANLSLHPEGVEDASIHQCTATREGEWIVFTCSKCPDYERRINLKTRAMQVTHGENPSTLHGGSYSQHDLDQAFRYPN